MSANLVEALGPALMPLVRWALTSPTVCVGLCVLQATSSYSGGSGVTLPEFGELLQSAVALEGLMVVLEAGVTQQQQDLHAKVRGQLTHLLHMCRTALARPRCVTVITTSKESCS